MQKNENEKFIESSANPEMSFQDFSRKISAFATEDFEAAVLKAKTAFEPNDDLTENERSNYLQQSARELFFMARDPKTKKSDLAEIGQAVSIGLQANGFEDYSFETKSKLRLAKLM